MPSYGRKLTDRNGNTVAPKTWAHLVYMADKTSVQNALTDVSVKATNNAASITAIVNGTTKVPNASNSTNATYVYNHAAGANKALSVYVSGSNGYVTM